MMSLALLAGCFLLALPTRVNSQLKRAVAGVFRPLLGLSDGASRQWDNLDFLTLSKADLWEENRQLRKELQHARISLLQKRAMEQENQTLRQSLGWESQQPWQMIPARIQVADPFNWWRSLYIDRGSSDGVMENTPVLCPQGLVGKVEQVEARRSLVRLVGDPHCRVAAMLEPAAAAKPLRAAHGTIMEGPQSAWNPRMVSFQHLPVDVRLEPGSQVVTSGMGGGFPKGIPVGRIVDSRPAESELFAEARVILGVDLNELEMVWLPLPQNRKETDAQPK